MKYLRFSKLLQLCENVRKRNWRASIRDYERSFSRRGERMKNITHFCRLYIFCFFRNSSKINLNFRICNRLYLWQWKDRHIRSDGQFSSNCDVVWYYLAHRRHVSRIEIYQLPATSDKEHGIDEINAGQRLDDIGTVGLLWLYRHFHLDQHIYEPSDIVT